MPELIMGWCYRQEPNKFSGVTRPYNLNRLITPGKELFYWKDLEAHGLVKASYDAKGSNKVLKYTQKVFYDNLWHLDWRIPLCRGLVLNRDDRVISRPFDKIFNYLGNGAGSNISQTKDVIAVDKVNGFMASITWHGSSFLVSTTGSLTGDHVTMAKEYLLLGGIRDVVRQHPKHTFIFEIVHPDDPHIVPELMGSHLIGCLEKWTNAKPAGEPHLDELASAMGVKRPHWQKIAFDKLLLLNSYSEHEGFVVRNTTSNNPMFKLKTPWYLTKKFLMRNNQWLFKDPEVYKKSLPEEFYPLMDHILSSWDKNDWTRLQPHQRGVVVEEFYYGFYGARNPFLGTNKR